MKFGENLYNLRKKSKMSQEDLAEKLDVSRQSISKWENGSAYPEMNRILELCKIFKCNLNDLVNANLLDLDSLDEEVKMNAVKFTKEKQKRLKVTSSIIYYCSRTLEVLTIIFSLILFISMFFVPMIIKEFNLELTHEYLNEEILNMITNIMSNNSNTKLIIYTETIIFCLIITISLITLIMHYISKLFKNISAEDTPFTLENMKYIKLITILFISYLFFPDITGTLFTLITKIDLGIDYEVAKLFYVLIIICIYYIFDYGHQLQLDSKGKIYSEVNSQK